jgi:hypothetical protein
VSYGRNLFLTAFRTIWLISSSTFKILKDSRLFLLLYTVSSISWHIIEIRIETFCYSEMSTNFCNRIRYVFMLLFEFFIFNYIVTAINCWTLLWFNFFCLISSICSLNNIEIYSPEKIFSLYVINLSYRLMLST